MHLEKIETLKKTASAPSGLDHNYLEVADCIFRLELQHGHLNWRVTRLSDLTKTHRTLLYYRFGNTKQKIFTNALDIVAKEFFGLSSERLALVAEGKGLECIRLSRELFKTYPHFGLLYFSIRLVGEAPDWLIALENLYRQKLKRIFPDRSETEIIALHGMLQGIILNPILTEEAFELALSHTLKPSFK